MTAAPDIFLSYNREDQATAQRFAESFEAHGLSVWWDVTLRSGEAYDQVTEEALRSARAVVVLWSKRSVESRWVRAEATVADRNGALVPVRIEPCDLPVMFELTQTADLSNWRGDGADPVWRELLADVRRMVDYEHTRSEETEPVSAAAAGGEGGIPFVAVLPIVYRAGDDELDTLAEDLCEEITRELAQNSFFQVIAAGIMAAWRGRVIDHRALGRELGASYLVEGRLRHHGESARLGLQVIDAGTGGLMRSLRISRSLADIAAEPEAFPVAVACELGEFITQIEMDRAMTRQGPLSGWHHVLRALAFMGSLGPDSEHRGLEEARMAVDLAPDLGLAHAMLAQLIGSESAVRLEDLDNGARHEIHEHIKRAMQLDGHNPVILNGVAAAFAFLGDAEACLRLARRAVALAPHSPVAQFTVAHAWFALGRTAEAITAFNEQLRLAPRDVNRSAALMLLGISLYAEGMPAAAEEAIDQSLALHPDYHVSLAWKAVVAAQQGRDQIARDAVMRMREAEPELTIDHHLRMLVYYPLYRERFADAAATLRRIWNETGGDG